MHQDERTFIIFNMSEINKIDFSQVLETSAETIRKSLDGTKTFVKWEGEIVPDFIGILTTKEGPYNYEEMIDILRTSEWRDNTEYTPPPSDDTSFE